MHPLPETYQFDGVTFTCVGAGMEPSTPVRFMLRKSSWIAARYTQLAAEYPMARIVELGIDQGASTAFLSLAFPGSRIAAFDLSATPPPALLGFVEQHGLSDRIAGHWGVDQADGGQVIPAIGAALGADPLDLVIDDASHLLDPSSGSFDLLFPRLRPGGRYILEDWSWDLQLERRLSETVAADPQGALARQLDAAASAGGSLRRRLRGAPDAERTPMARLVLVLSLACATHPEVIEQLVIRPGWVEVLRGSGEVGSGFALTDLVGRTGRRALTG